MEEPTTYISRLPAELQYNIEYFRKANIVVAEMYVHVYDEISPAIVTLYNKSLLTNRINSINFDFKIYDEAKTILDKIKSGEELYELLTSESRMDEKNELKTTVFYQPSQGMDPDLIEILGSDGIYFDMEKDLFVLLLEEYVDIVENMESRTHVKVIITASLSVITEPVY